MPSKPLKKKTTSHTIPKKKKAISSRHRIKLVIGLGNPGKEYEATRHNIGRTVVLDLARQHELESEVTKEALVCTGKISDAKAILLLPELFMNNSGKAIKPYAMSAKPAQVLVVHDDVDIPLGTIKLSFGKHSAGHKGVESIMRVLGSIEFWRLRIGVAPLGKKKIPAMELVLKKFTPSEQTALKKIKKEAASKIEAAIVSSPQVAQSI